MADTATPAKARVLVVDDSSLVRLYYRTALRGLASRSNRRSMASRQWRRCCRNRTIW